MYPEIDRLVTELVAAQASTSTSAPTPSSSRRSSRPSSRPSKYLSFSVHLDGLREEHDEAVCREGVYDQAVEAIREALRRGFRVTTNSTLFDGASPIRMRMFFDEMMDLGVEGMMLSPGYSYAKAPDQEHFLRRQKTHELFSEMLDEPQEALEVQPVAAVPAVPHGQAGLRVHAVGHARPTTSSAGSARAISCRKATRRPSRT